MRIKEILEDIPPLGQPTRSTTQTKADLTNPPEPFRWKVTAVRGEDDDVTHEFTVLGGRIEANKKAKEWFKDTFGREPRSGEYFIDPAPRTARVGSGSFSDVRLHPSQHEVVKRERYPGEMNLGGQAWTDAVIKYNETNPLGNPWLPYITELRTVTDPEDVTRTQVTQGRLESGYDLSLEAIEYIANRIFSNFSASLTSAISKQAKPARYWDEFVRIIAGILVKPSLASVQTIEKKVKGRVVEVPNPYYTEDENMLEALALVNQTARKYKLSRDLHSENIMVRNTGRGWQPVLTDPIA